jgi:asparagine synthase (glutamine-hydrolysing)
MLADTLEGVDALMAGWGLEARHPFFDRRVVEYCLALPPEQRLKGGWTRSIVRRALGAVLPTSVTTRVGKADLGIQLPERLIEHEENRLEDILHADALHPYVSPEQIQGLYEAFRGEMSIRRLTPILRLVVLALWLDQEAGNSLAQERRNAETEARLIQKRQG